MPTFRVTSPDGKAYTVQAPQGATQQQAIQFIQKTYPATQPGQRISHTPEGDTLDGPTPPGLIENILNAPSNFASGAARGLAGDVSGAIQLLSGGRYRGGPLYDFSQGGPTGLASGLGRFVGAGLPLMAVPEVGAAGLLGRLGLKLAPRAARLAESAAQGGIAGALQPTEEGDIGSHLENAATGAAAGGALRAAGGKALRTAFGPAMEARAAGVRVPPQGRAAGFYERAASHLPGGRGVFTRAQQQAEQDWMQRTSSPYPFRQYTPPPYHSYHFSRHPLTWMGAYEFGPHIFGSHIIPEFLAAYGPMGLWTGPGARALGALARAIPRPSTMKPSQYGRLLQQLAVARDVGVRGAGAEAAQPGSRDETGTEDSLDSD